MRDDARFVWKVIKLACRRILKDFLSGRFDRIFRIQMHFWGLWWISFVELDEFLENFIHKFWWILEDFLVIYLNNLILEIIRHKRKTVSLPHPPYPITTISPPSYALVTPSPAQNPPLHLSFSPVNEKKKKWNIGLFCWQQTNENLVPGECD